jgi:hypothetical protein
LIKRWHQDARGNNTPYHLHQSAVPIKLTSQQSYIDGWFLTS